VLGLSLVAAPSFAADSRNVSVINETGYAIKFLGFNAPDDGLDEWENELDETLKNQDTAYVEFDEDDQGCVWNIKVDWASYDESVLWKNVNLCNSTCSGCVMTPGPRRPRSWPSDRFISHGFGPNQGGAATFAALIDCVRGCG
jgi:hypothetical protein